MNEHLECNVVQSPLRRSGQAVAVRPVDVVHLGPQKAGTTWLHRCLAEHPQVACAPKHCVHYFDIFYEKGPAWYAQHYADARDGQLIFDNTPSYIRSTLAPKRIFAVNPRAKLAVTLRHPIDRAFSHYWHEKKKGKYNFDFHELLKNYDLFSSWLEPGFYAEHIERYLGYFPRSQILCQRFELLRDDPRTYLSELLDYMGVAVDRDFSCMDRKMNEAGGLWTLSGRARWKTRKGLALILGEGFLKTRFAKLLAARHEYDRGIESDYYNELLELCIPEIERLESLLDIDLTDWKAFRP